MGVVIALLIVGAVVLLLWQLSKDSARPPVAPSTPAAPARIEETPAEPLSARLHRLGSELESFADNSSHPRDLIDRREFTDGVAILSAQETSLESIKQYALGTNWCVACIALAALARRPDRDALAGEVLGHMPRFGAWPLYFALMYFVSLEKRPAVGAPLRTIATWWPDHAVIPMLVREYLARREELGDVPQFGESLASTRGSPATDVESLLTRIDHPYARALLDDFRRWRSTSIDREFLQSAGRFWEAEERGQLLVTPDCWKSQVAEASAALAQTQPRSLLVSGEPRVGKTSLLRLLGVHLQSRGWVVFEASGADLMADQIYIGQLEGRIRAIVDALGMDKRVAWYIPDLLQMASSGTHKGQSASILDQIIPAISAGKLLVLAEATPLGITRLLQLRPSMRSLFEMIRMRPLTESEALALAQQFVARMQNELGLECERNFLTIALSLARQYLGSSQLPGSLIDLIKLSANRATANVETVLTRSGLLATLSQLTGLPLPILDDSERVDLMDLRRFFSSRVIGQDEAIAAIVERIAMLKAGLIDSTRPIAVFLFAGPTGTGKTEAAKTLAQYLFGSPDRMIRLDMSEFQNAESTRKILGDSGDAADTESLIARVRKQPFSVLLLDEFEKAHANAWDLFLQVFDDGRLSDATGRVADFRHCIICLTSNLGATSHQSAGLGFAPKADAFAPDQVRRTISKTFRPEFVNRLDRIIVFQPLNRDQMREILKKELRQVLDRRGLRDREWAVEWEISAQEFLLDKGFSPAMGARPLKRAIDQYLLAPLAATIVEHRFPHGDQFLFVRSDGNSIQVEFVDPNATPGSAAPDDAAPDRKQIATATMVLQPAGSADERKALADAIGSVQERLSGVEWTELKNALTQEMADAGFWTRADRHHALARFALMDRVQEAVRMVHSLNDRLIKSARRTGQPSRELVARLALQVHLVNLGIVDALQDFPVEVALSVEPALDGAGDTRAAAAWCAQLTEMYRNWGRQRRMQIAELSDGPVSEPRVLLVAGFGAHSVLTGEAGLHILETSDDESGRRAVARVRVVATPYEEIPQDRALRVHVDRLARGPVGGTVVRRYRAGASPLVRDGLRGWRTGRLDEVLGGNFDLMA